MTSPLERFGYTPREARFLTLAGPVSGLFCRRHFNRFAGGECGAVAQRFINRALSLGHVTQLGFSAAPAIYHVSSLAIYASVGDGQSRNRREHSPETIRRRLMALDYCLAEDPATVLTTDAAKYDRLTSCGADVPRTSPLFLGKQPLRSLADGTIEFCFIDSGFRTHSHLEIFLKAHREIFQGLRQAAFVFATCDPDRVRSAQHTFRKVVSGLTVEGEVDHARLRDYFAARKSFDEGCLNGFDQRRLNELREAKRIFGSPALTELYGRWLQAGDGVLPEAVGVPCRFRSHLLPHCYEWLSPIPIPERRAHALNRITTKEK